MADHPLIETHKIRKVYGVGEGQTVALDDITLTIPRDQFLAIMGPSGSGKSTLLQILGLLDKQSSGTYLFNGVSSEAYAEDELARLRNEHIGFVFQSFNLLPKTSVYENVLLPLIYSNVPDIQWKKRDMDSIEAVGLSHRTAHESNMLSGGEKQRCAIARALVMNPVLIFADEPTGNLDSASGRMVMETLEHLHAKQGHTIMLITHEQPTAEHAERIITIRDGIIESDSQNENRRFTKDGYRK